MDKSAGQTAIASARLDSLRESVIHHPLYDAIRDRERLKVFMEHHVYAVWDFMSLIKALQIHLAPTDVPWLPPKNPHHAHFINQLVLQEESDRAITDKPGVTHASHFESYRQAMVEVGANVGTIARFMKTVRAEGPEAALHEPDVPEPARRFVTFTFDVIRRNRPHLLAAALAYGREALVPLLFRSLLEGIDMAQSEAFSLYGYIERHIELDEQEHGPFAVRMANELCEDSPEKRAEAIEVAEQALAARLDLWDGIYEALSA